MSGTGGGFFGAIVERPVAAMMAVVACVVFGLVSLQRLPLALMPDLGYPTLTVRTLYDGAAPQEVEAQVSRPLEQGLSTVSGLQSLSSMSRPGQSDIVLQFNWGTDMDGAAQGARERASLVDLPEGATRPLLLRYDPNREPVLRLALSGGEDLIRLRAVADEVVARRLQALDGVAAVKVTGGLTREIEVGLDAAALHARGLTAEGVAERLRQANVNLAGGSLREGDTEYLIRTLNEMRRADELGRIAVGGAPDGPVLLDQVATLRSTHRERDVVARARGQEAVQLSLYKEADANLVEVCQRVRLVLFGESGSPPERKPGAGGAGGAQAAGQGNAGGKGDGQDAAKGDAQETAEAEAQGAAAGTGKAEGKDEDDSQDAGGARPVVQTLPAGLDLSVLQDQSTFVRASLKDVSDSAWQGGVLAIAVLFLFLRHGWSTFIVGIVLPVSVAITFAPLYLDGVSLNVMSLGGLALGIGNLIDNAIVVLESIHRCREEGDDHKQAALRGTREVASAVAASTATTVAVFLPITFIEGIAGRLFSDLALTVVYAQVVSLGVALILVPVLAARGAIHLDRAPSRVRALAPISVLATADEAMADLRAARRWVAEAPGLRRAVRWVGFAAAAAWILLRAATVGAIAVFAAAVLGAVAGGALLVRPLWRRLGPRVGSVATRGLDGFERAFQWLASVYDVALRGVLLRPAAALLPAAGLFAASMLLVPRLGSELIPEVHRAQFEVLLSLPVGSPLDRTVAMVDRVAARVEEVPGVVAAFATAGAARDADAASGEGDHSARLLVTLTAGTRPKAEEQAKQRVRDVLAGFPDLRAELMTGGLFSVRTPIEVAVFGDSLSELKVETDAVAETLRGVKGLTDVRSSIARGYPEVQITYDRDRLAAVGLDAAAVARAVRDQVQGRIPTSLSGGERQVDVRVLLGAQSRESVRNLQDLNVNPAGLPAVPLSAVATLVIGEGPSEIRRIDQRRAGVVTANPAGFDLGWLTRAVAAGLEQRPAAPGFQRDLGGQSREMSDSQRELGFALVLAIFLVYVIMAAQFESVFDPLVILFSVPLALVGVVLALLIVGVPLSVLVLIGVIVLAGIVVNNAIVLLDYAGLLRQRGLPRDEAIRQAGRVRLRPILMTALTTVVGLVPMALGVGEGAELRRPLAITLIAGLSSATLLTLLVIPAVYVALDRRRE